MPRRIDEVEKKLNALQAQVDGLQRQLAEDNVDRLIADAKTSKAFSEVLKLDTVSRDSFTVSLKELVERLRGVLDEVEALGARVAALERRD